MKGDTKVIDILNGVLTGELTAINQYFLHSKMCKNWGFERLAHTIYKESIDEMKHAQDLIERILFLEGIPNVQKLGPITIGQNVPEILELDLELEEAAIPRLRKGIEICFSSSDHGSRELLEHILVDEERHADWLESQIHLIKETGKETYLAQQIHSQKS